MIELLILSSNELRYVRTLLACLKTVKSGIDIDLVTLVNLEEEHEYLKSRNDIDRVLDYRGLGEYQWMDQITDYFLRNDAKGDFVLRLHPDCFPIKDNWAVPLLDKAEKYGIGGYCVLFEELVENGVDISSYVIMFNVEYICKNDLSTLCFFLRENEPVVIYESCELIHKIPPPANKFLIESDLGIAIYSVLDGGKPIVLDTSNFELVHDYFLHMNAGSVVINSSYHPLSNFKIPVFATVTMYAQLSKLHKLYTSDKYAYLDIYNEVKSDGCPKELQRDVYTFLYEMDPF